jgi:hypothetical protein
MSINKKEIMAFMDWLEKSMPYIEFRSKSYIATEYAKQMKDKEEPFITNTPETPGNGNSIDDLPF